jgi:ATP-binding cassette subfamily C protein CydC
MPRCASPATCACGSSAARCHWRRHGWATRTGELLARLLGDIGEVDGLLVRAIGPLVALGALSLVAVASAALILPSAAVLLAVLALLIAFGVPWLGVRGHDDEEADRAAHRAALRTAAFEGLEGAGDLAALHADAAGS